MLLLMQLEATMLASFNETNETQSLCNQQHRVGQRLGAISRAV